MSFNCEKCDYIATNKEELDKHDGLQHVQSENYKCYMCKKEFMLKHGVIKHAEDKHKKELEGQFFCMSCWNCTTIEKIRSRTIAHKTTGQELSPS